MIIRVESGVTMLVSGAHYIKESVAFEFDHPEIKALAHRLIPLANEDLPEEEDIRTLYFWLHDTIADALWDAVVEQIDVLKGDK